MELQAENERLFLQVSDGVSQSNISKYLGVPKDPNKVEQSELDYSEYYNSRFEGAGRGARNMSIKSIALSNVSGIKHLRNEMHEINEEFKVLGIQENKDDTSFSSKV